LLSFSLNLQAQIEDKILPGNPPLVTIASTQLLSINSSITGENYDLYVSLPGNYGDTSRVYAVVYLLDAQWDFPLVQAIYGQQYYDGFIPGMVVVGITWGGPGANYDSLRTRDFTPTPTTEKPYGGNAKNFLQFIKKELIPFIESKYRVKNNDRTLIGTSLGGLFTLYTLFHETNLFNRYILTSPAVPWDNDIVYSYEKEFAAKNSRLPVKMFMGVGEYEDTSVFKKFVKVFKSRNYEGLKLETRVLNGVGHSGTKALGYTWGIQSVFSRPTLDISSSEIQQYAGTYQVSAGKVIKLYLTEGTDGKNQLIMQDTDSTKMPLTAETNKDFYVKGTFINIHFKLNYSGKVLGFQIERYTGVSFAQAVSH
jgi:predicted alpha/beta superfamily hydrolase